jgi:O-antigen/teichoic acid export membrane protein
LIAEDVGQPALNLVIVGISAVLGWGLAGAVNAVLWSFALAAAVGLYFAHRLFGWLLDGTVRSRHSRASLLAFAIPAMLASSLPVLLTWTDRLVIGATRPADEMGVYQAVSQLPIVFSLILSGIGGSVLGPIMAELHANDQHERLCETFLVATKWGAYAAVPAFLVLLLFRDEVLAVLFGAQYLVGSRALLLLTCAGFANAISGPVGLLLIMTGHERRWLAISATSLALDLFLQWQLTPHLGLVGAATATLATLVFLFGAGLLQAWRLGYWPYDRRFWKGAAAAAASLTTGVIVSKMTPAWPATGILLVGSLSIVGTYGFVLHQLGLEEEDQAIVHSLRRFRRSRPPVES